MWLLFLNDLIGTRPMRGNQPAPTPCSYVDATDKYLYLAGSAGNSSGSYWGGIDILVPALSMTNHHVDIQND